MSLDLSARRSDGLTAASDVGIVHDYLNQRGGAERVVLEMARIWPHAPIYTSLYREDSTFPEFRGKDVRTSPLQALPIDKGFRALAPAYPLAFRSLGTLSHELVISSSSGWAHGVRTAPETTHVVYCYAPARWLYSPERYFGQRSLSHTAARALNPALRRWDRRSAQHADGYITIADNVRRRVHAAYGIDSQVVYPPVDVDRFTPRPRGERLLVVSRLLPYKRIDLAVRAATKLSIGLDVVGTGPSLRDLQAMAGPTVTFHGRLDDGSVTEMMERCRALVMPGEEDFGIVPIEANAAGKPAVVYAAGGALETMVDGETAAYFHEPTVEALAAAIHRSDALKTEPEALGRHAERFSTDNFRVALVRAVGKIHVRHSRLRAPA